MYIPALNPDQPWNLHYAGLTWGYSIQADIRLPWEMFVLSQRPEEQTIWTVHYYCTSVKYSVTSHKLKRHILFGGGDGWSDRLTDHFIYFHLFSKRSGKCHDDPCKARIVFFFTKQKLNAQDEGFDKRLNREKQNKPRQDEIRFKIYT